MIDTLLKTALAAAGVTPDMLQSYINEFFRFIHGLEARLLSIDTAIARVQSRQAVEATHVTATLEEILARLSALEAAQAQSDHHAAKVKANEQYGPIGRPGNL